VNDLLTMVHNSLTDLGKAVRGPALMGADLDAVGKALFDGKVPAMWLLPQPQGEHMLCVH